MKIHSRKNKFYITAQQGLQKCRRDINEALISVK